MDELSDLFWSPAAYNFHITATYIKGFKTPSTMQSPAFTNWTTAPFSSQDNKAFNWVDKSHTLHLLTYSAFVKRLCYHLSYIRADTKLYPGHSFHRGVHPLPINWGSLLNWSKLEEIAGRTLSSCIGDFKLKCSARMLVSSQNIITSMLKFHDI